MIRLVDIHTGNAVLLVTIDQGYLFSRIFLNRKVKIQILLRLTFSFIQTLTTSHVYPS